MQIVKKKVKVAASAVRIPIAVVESRMGDRVEVESGVGLEEGIKDTYSVLVGRRTGIEEVRKVWGEDWAMTYRVVPLDRVEVDEKLEVLVFGGSVEVEMTLELDERGPTGWLGDVVWSSWVLICSCIVEPSLLLLHVPPEKEENGNSLPVGEKDGANGEEGNGYWLKLRSLAPLLLSMIFILALTAKFQN
jgi:hypothetical protein